MKLRTTISPLACVHFFWSFFSSSFLDLQRLKLTRFSFLLALWLSFFSQPWLHTWDFLGHGEHYRHGEERRSWKRRGVYFWYGGSSLSHTCTLLPLKFALTAFLDLIVTFFILSPWNHRVHHPHASVLWSYSCTSLTRHSPCFGLVMALAVSNNSAVD